MAYHKVHRLDTRIARIFNTYGPRMRTDDGRVIPTFITQAINGEDLTVFGDGSQTRSFCYIDDMISGILKLMFSNFNMPINLGNPSEISILSLARLIIKMTGSKSNISFRPLPEGDPKVRKPNIDRAIKNLGWEPSTNMEEGLNRTLQYFQRELKT
jgi:dTDP-glucose 4,6-dehydratase